MNLNQELVKDNSKRANTHGPVISQRKIVFYQDGDYKSDTVTIFRYSDGTVILDNGKVQFIQRPACLLTRTLSNCSIIKELVRKKVAAVWSEVKRSINCSSR